MITINASRLEPAVKTIRASKQNLAKKASKAETFPKVLNQDLFMMASKKDQVKSNWDNCSFYEVSF